MISVVLLAKGVQAGKQRSETVRLHKRHVNGDVWLSKWGKCGVESSIHVPVM